MAFYNRLKEMKNAPIGTIMPWGGTSSITGNNPSGIPRGWLVCNGQTHPCNNYPLLASMLGNTYGPEDDSIVGNFPDYEDADVFRVPNLNNRAMVDLELEMLQESKYQYGQSDAENIIGEYISEDGTGVTPPTIWTADTNLLFDMDNNNAMAGKIKDITLNDPTWSRTYYTIGRKLGIDHTPGHKHSGQYTTAFPSGKYVQVFEAPTVATSGTPNYETANLNGVSSTDSPDTWRNGFGGITYYDENVLVLTDEAKSFTQDQVPAAGLTRTIPSTGAFTDSFQDTYNYNHHMKQHTGVFPPPTEIFGRPNYLNGDVSTTYPTTLSHTGQDFTDAQVATHNHFSFDVSMNAAGLKVPPTIAINNVQSYTVNVSDIPDALTVIMDNNTPSQTIIMIIRAY